MNILGWDLLSAAERREMSALRARALHLHEQQEAARPTLLKMDRLTVTDAHVALLRRVNVRELRSAGFPVAAMDVKRPYGNSDVVADLADVAGLAPDADGVFAEGDIRALEALHVEVMACMAILVNTGECVAGRTYTRPRFGARWERVA